MSKSRQEVAQIDAVDVLHREEVVVANFTELEDLDDVRVVEADGDLGFVDEHGDEAWLLRMAGENAFDNELFGEAFGAKTACQIHLGHAACAEFADQLKVAEGRRTLPFAIDANVSQRQCRLEGVEGYRVAGSQALPDSHA